jgi:hypothetical protein
MRISMHLRRILIVRCAEVDVTAHMAYINECVISLTDSEYDMRCGSQWFDRDM